MTFDIPLVFYTHIIPGVIFWGSIILFAILPVEMERRESRREELMRNVKRTSNLKGKF